MDKPSMGVGDEFRANWKTFEALTRAVLDDPEAVAEIRHRHQGPAWKEDQRRAAVNETGAIWDTATEVWRLLEPRGQHAVAVDRAAGIALLTAALSRCAPCHHLKANIDQPGVAVLAEGRLKCARCTRTRRLPPAEHDDRCDLCHEHGHDTFWPLALRLESMLVVGDLCRACAALAGFDVEGREAAQDPNPKGGRA